MPRNDGAKGFQGRTRKRRKRVGKRKEQLATLRAQGVIAAKPVQARRPLAADGSKQWP